ncbi:MAG: exodeoxyribonuclease III [Rickettsiaceae bacterium]|nr:exodeoxyribonuclease III [Rickettsiaceae bacterium]
MVVLFTILSLSYHYIYLIIMTQILKIATWNVNSIRTRVDQVLEWIQSNAVDILLLQELKCTQEQFPYVEFEDAGYNCYTHCQKTYNGVAILSKIRASNISKDFECNPCPDEARFIEIELQTTIGYIKVSSVYVPNGAEVGSSSFAKKLAFLDGLRKYYLTNALNHKYIVGGDFNVAPEDIDVFSSSELSGELLFTIEEREKIRAIKYIGMQDPAELQNKNRDFTWWDYRGGAFFKNRGARIDYFLASPFSICNIKEIYTDRQARSVERASDHAPILLILN